MADVAADIVVVSNVVVVVVVGVLPALVSGKKLSLVQLLYCIYSYNC